jgi:hypothetical protein
MGSEMIESQIHYRHHSNMKFDSFTSGQQKEQPTPAG